MKAGRNGCRVNAAIASAPLKLWQVCRYPKFCELGENVPNIRRTVKGGLLLQLRRSRENTENFKGASGEALGKSESVRTLKDMGTIQIKDIDHLKGGCI